MPQPLLDYFKKYLLKRTPGVKDVHTPGVNIPGVNLSPASIKNYLSDVSLFLGWLSRSLQKDSLMAENITPANISAYQKYLSQNLQPATCQRHLSSLRCFGQFLLNTNRLSNDPTKDLINPKPAPVTTTWPKLIQQYQDFLKRENLSASTIKNYVSDLNNYVAWQENHSRSERSSHSGNEIQGPTFEKKHPRGERSSHLGGEISEQKGRTLLGIFKKLTDNNLNNRSVN